MEPLKNHLKDRFKVYSIDIIGFGKSDLPKEPMSTDDFGNFLKEFLTKLNIENPILIGHSNGGRTIINYAGRNLGKINKIILIDSAGIKPKRTAKYYIKVYTFKTLSKILNISKSTKKLKEKYINKFASTDYKNAPMVLRRTMSKILNEDQKELMKNINAETLIFWGDKDLDTPLKDGIQMEKLIKGSGLVVLEGTGHYSYLEKLNECLIIIDEFLKKDF